MIQCLGMEKETEKGNMFFYVFVGIVVLVLLAVIYTNYNPQLAEQLKNEQNTNINNSQEQNNINTMDQNTTTGTTTSESSERVVQNGDTVYVHYTGTLEDGTKFDSSVDRGIPFDFVVGAGMVIKGWDQGLLGMKVGEKKRLVLPPDLAYGPAGITAPDGTVVIPKNATLIFDIELISIN